MKAYIKKNKWKDFKKNYVEYDFSQAYDPKYGYVSIINNDPTFFLIVIRKTRELKLIVGTGESPFMESQKQYYLKLYQDDYIEFKKGRFD